MPDKLYNQSSDEDGESGEYEQILDENTTMTPMAPMGLNHNYWAPSNHNQQFNNNEDGNQTTNLQSYDTNVNGFVTSPASVADDHNNSNALIKNRDLLSRTRLQRQIL